MMSFIGEVEDAPAFKFIEDSDFSCESIEGGLRKVAKFLGGETKDLCRVEETRDGGERMVESIVFEWFSP